MKRRADERETYCYTLAKAAEAALIAEVTLSPKPGLVDSRSRGSHDDMDHALFVRSAESLTPYFEKMARCAWRHEIDQELREMIAEIGRAAEDAMFAATGGVNTHKGAIWTLGLLISVLSSRISLGRHIAEPAIFSAVSCLASFPDTRYEVKKQKQSHGQAVKRQYGTLGAAGEAIAGYPHIQIALAEYRKRLGISETKRQLHMLLALIASLDDTCILFRSNAKILSQVKSLAAQANQAPLPNPAFSKLQHLCQKERISPGGSADLLAASLFLLAVENHEQKWQWTLTTNVLYNCINN